MSIVLSIVASPDSTLDIGPAALPEAQAAAPRLGLDDGPVCF